MKNAKNDNRGFIWWLCIGLWWIPVKWLCFKLPFLIIKTLISYIKSKHTSNSSSVLNVTAPSQNIVELPKMVDGNLLAYQYINEISIYEGLSNYNSIMKYISSNIGKEIKFVQEPTNSYDEHAIKIFLNNRDIGYVFRGQTQDMINGWIKKSDPIVAYICDCDGKCAHYNIGFYKLGGRTENRLSESSIQSNKVNIFTKKWSNACYKNHIVLDFETTGFSDKKDRIIEIAAIKYESGIEVDKFISFVNPQRHIPNQSTSVHHITDDMVKNAPTEEEILPKLIDFLSDSIIVGHNICFDLRFLESATQRLGIDVQYNYIDTLFISRRLFPELDDHKLGTVAEHIGFKTENFHRAETDVKACEAIIKYALDCHNDEANNLLN